MMMKPAKALHVANSAVYLLYNSSCPPPAVSITHTTLTTPCVYHSHDTYHPLLSITYTTLTTPFVYHSRHLTTNTNYTRCLHDAPKPTNPLNPNPEP